MSLLVGETRMLPRFFFFVIRERLDCALAYSVAFADVALDVGDFAGVEDFTRSCVELAALTAAMYTWFSYLQ